MDSGVGGLLIWREIVAKLTQESTIYVADSKHCPYGERSAKQILKFSKRLVQFLVDKKCKLIVLACNTITVSCLDKLRKDFPNAPIIGTVPVIKTACERSKNRKIGILSTKTTAKSQYQKDLIKQFAGDCEVINIGTDKLVPFVEKGDLQSRLFKVVLREELKPLILSRIDVLALGCSHFPFLKDQMQEILGSKVLILDSAEAIARQVERVLVANNSLSQTKKSQQVLYTTGNKARFAIIVKKFLKGFLKGVSFSKETP